MLGTELTDQIFVANPARAFAFAPDERSADGA